MTTKANNVRKWKIELSDVVLTREFKPQICRKYSGGYVCKVVFDVTPIVRSKPLTSYKVSIFYPEMNNEISLLHIGFLTLINDRKTYARYVYLNEPLVLCPRERVDIKLPFVLKNAYVKMTVTLPHSSAQLTLLSDQTRIEISGYQGSLEYTNNIKGIRSLSISHMGSGVYLPREVIVSSLLLYETNAPKPELRASIDVIDNSKAKVLVENVGDNEASNVIVVNIAVGNVVDRKIIDGIKPGEGKSVTISIKPGYLNIVRVIWRYKDNTYVIERKIRAT